jgi:cell division protease FtsH
VPRQASKRRDPFVNKSRDLSFAYVMLGLGLIFVLQYLLLSKQPETISYSQFKTLLRKGHVAELTVHEKTISGSIKVEGLKELLAPEKFKTLGDAANQPMPFVAVRVEDAHLTADLEAAGVPFKGEVSSDWLSNVLSLIVPAIIFFGLWAFLLNRIGGGAGGGLMQIGKSKAKVYIEKSTGVTFADVEGIEEAEEELIEVVDFLKQPEKYQRLGGHIPKGVLLVGPPGTGKTLLARAVAGEAGVPFFSISGSHFVEMFVGVGAARVRDLFSQAAEHAPSIIFIDELDALGKARGMSMLSSHDEREQTLNQLLAEMDGFDPNKGVIMMAATNRPEILDPALLRPGRFDRQVLVDRPDVKGREKILRLHAKKIKLAPTVDLSLIAAKTPGFVGADLANIVNEAALLAARRGKDAVESNDFDEAIERVVAGLQKKNRVMNPKEKRTVAYHESGHALVAELVPGADPVAKISIIPRGIAALGYTQQTATEDRYLLTQSELMARVYVLLGGRVAEEMVFGDVSTGAQNDLQRATEIARTMVTQFGMSSEVGLVALEGPRQPLFLPVPMPSVREYSEDTARLIDNEVKKILTDAHGNVTEILAAHRSALEDLAQLLLQKEVVERPELQTILKVVSIEKAKEKRRSASGSPEEKTHEA